MPLSQEDAGFVQQERIQHMVLFAPIAQLELITQILAAQVAQIVSNVQLAVIMQTLEVQLHLLV